VEVIKAIHPRDFENYTTDKIRKEFLLQNLFIPGKLRLTYTYYDRMIVGGVCPNKPLFLEAGKEIGADYFLAGREMGIINVGARGAVMVDGEKYALYLLSGPAHKEYPTTKMGIDDAEKTSLGSASESNKRTLNKFIHPDGVNSCQLVMGITALESGNVWNSMPCHTHERRMEVYFYFNLADDAVVFHLMGEPDETRHIVVRNEEAVLSPSWSIHAGAGTSNYSFIWGMVGENQTFTDMDTVAMGDLR
jgi:4-deoxy-L-threo-5-hexosulose-uronate ketol-isomerase